MRNIKEQHDNKLDYNFYMKIDILAFVKPFFVDIIKTESETYLIELGSRSIAYNLD